LTTSAQAAESDHSRGEFETIARWLSVLPCAGGEGPFRPGDDAVWLDCPAPIAISVDTMVEDIHFRRGWCTPRDLGWRVLQAALSDLAASRARPLGFLLSLSVPAADFADPAWLDEVIAGLGEAAEATSCTVLGGDTTGSPSGLVIAVTVLGRTVEGSSPLGRGGAQQGELLQLSGATGWAALALRHLLNSPDPSSAAIPEAATRAWRRPRARFDLLAALEAASAAIDISDGLLADARHLCEASACSLVLHRDAITDPKLVETVGSDDALSLALSGGEDYEILATAARPLAGFRTIGAVASGHGIHWQDGSEVCLTGRDGWDHGRPG